MRKTLFAALVVAACAPRAPDVTMAPGPDDALPAPPLAILPVTARSPLPALRSNAEMARDFLDLEFQMESGRRLPRLTRFDGPVTIGFLGPAPATAVADLKALVARIRTEAGIDLRILPPGGTPAISLVFSTRATLAATVPTAACFVVPGVASLAEYRVRRSSPDLDWARMARRERAAVFLPADTSPQEMRDCLHEEVAQALGPVNDLYRLSDSVMNDDNFQSVLTGFDMLMLRIHYAPELANGMTEAEVAARLPVILARMNPRGASGPAPVPEATPRPWIAAVEAALGRKAGPVPARLAQAQRALVLARAQGWQDARLGLSYFAIGKAQTPIDPGAARAAYAAAYAVYATLPDGGVHAAHVAMQLAALDLRAGRLDDALAWIARARPALPVAENPALAATLTLIEAAVAEARGQLARARALRLDTAALARYGFGSTADVAAREAEIARLAGLPG